MTILYIDGADAAQALGAAHQETVAEFKRDVALSSGGMSDITLVAQTRDNATTLCGRTPEALADDFAVIISKKNRSRVQHIYLLESAAGMRKHRELSLAQRFADAMDVHGFNNLQVHAVTSPGVPIFGMGVEIVVDKAPSPNRRAPVVHVEAFYYKDLDSSSVDGAILTASDALELSQKELDAFPRSTDLTREQRAKMRAEEERMRKHKKLYHTLLSKRKNNTHYHANKVDILSTVNYKEAMQQPCNTYLPQVAEPIMSPEVSYAIYYLSSQRRCTDVVNNDLLTLRSNPSWNSEEIIRLLQMHRDTRGEKFYYTMIAQPLEKKLQEQDFTMLQCTRPPRGVANDSAALKKHGFFVASPASNVPTLQGKLESYKKQRESEWWGFHYNFLGIVSVIYFISDCLCGTDYYNSKHREIKISAASKLLKGTALTDFTSHEVNALQEGRLGKIVNDHGGLEAVIDAFAPVADESANQEPDQDDVFSTGFAVPGFTPFDN